MKKPKNLFRVETLFVMIQVIIIMVDLYINIVKY
jgi:hypothetical protein